MKDFIVIVVMTTNDFFIIIKIYIIEAHYVKRKSVFSLFMKAML
jgi:hypothetical protein